MSAPGEAWSSQTTAGDSDVLCETVRPELYRLNAFRVAGLPVDATMRDISRHTEKLKMMGKLGTGAHRADGFLSLDPAPDADAMREAMQRLRDPERRLVDEFFWFWPHDLGKSRNDGALAALARGDVQEAAEIWMEQEKAGSESGVSTHNLAVLAHAAALDLEHAARSGRLAAEKAGQRGLYWQQASHRWKRLLDQEGFWSRLASRIRELDDPRLTTGTARRIRASLPLALLSINAELAVRAAERGDNDEMRRQLELMERWEHQAPNEQQVCPSCGRSGNALRCDSCGVRLVTRTFRNEALARAVAPIRERIKSLCATAEPEADARPEHADQVTRRLMDQTRPLLDVLDCVLPSDSSTRTAAHDEVALRALACEIPFANKSENWKVALELLELAIPLASSESARARLQENLKTVQGNLEYQEEFGTCWFCKERPAERGAETEVKMHGNVTRTPTWQGTHIQWRTSTISVPRCHSCKEAHEGMGTWVLAGGVTGLLIGMGACWVAANLASKADTDAAGIVSFLIGAGLFTLIGYLCGLARFPKGIKHESAKNEFPAVKRKKAEGWEFGEKPSGVQ
jgi:hypothetical protein